MTHTKKTLAVVADEELESVAGGFWHFVHLARTAAVIVAGGYAVIKEATKSPEATAPDLSGIRPSPEQL